MSMYVSGWYPDGSEVGSPASLVRTVYTGLRTGPATHHMILPSSLHLVLGAFFPGAGVVTLVVLLMSKQPNTGSIGSQIVLFEVERRGGRG